MDLNTNKTNDFDARLTAAQNAVAAHPNDKKLWAILHEAQADYVNAKLKSDLLKTLEDKKDYTTLYAVYQKLLTIFPESKKLKKLLKNVREKIGDAAEEEKRNFYASAKTKIIELMRLGRFSDAEQACYEILSGNPNNKTFTALLAKIESRLDVQMDKDMDAYYKIAIPTLKTEFSANKAAFIRV